MNKRDKEIIKKYVKNIENKKEYKKLYMQKLIQNSILYTNIYSYARRKFFRFIKLNYFQTMHMIKKKGIKDIHKEL